MINIMFTVQFFYPIPIICYFRKFMIIWHLHWERCQWKECIIIGLFALWTCFFLNNTVFIEEFGWWSNWYYTCICIDCLQKKGTSFSRYLMQFLGLKSLKDLRNLYFLTLIQEIILQCQRYQMHGEISQWYLCPKKEIKKTPTTIEG